MFTNGGFHSHVGNNGVKFQQQPHTNQAGKTHQSTATKASFIKRFNPFSKSKSQTINCNSDCAKHESLSDKEFASVKVLKQFWNDQIKTAKSSEHLNRKSATIRYFSQSNDSLNEPRPDRAEKSLTLDGRLPSDEFNKFKDANFVRNKKNRLKGLNGSDVLDVKEATRYSRPENFTLNDNNFPQVSATGGKIHWAKREDIFTKKTPADDVMSVKSNKAVGKATKNGQKSGGESRKESMTSSSASIASTNTNSASRKFSFKTAPSTTSSYMNKKIAATSNGTKVAQIAQRFNQMIQQDATLLDEVKKRGTVVLHRSGGCVFKIKEEKVDGKSTPSLKRVTDDASDDAASLLSVGKNSTRKKSALKKRPSIRILVESPRKDGKGGNVLSKKQLYETNIVNKETIVIKPKVPDKSERVLAKTKELLETRKTEAAPDEDHAPLSPAKKNNFQKIYDKISFRPTFLYGKKTNKLETTLEAPAKPNAVQAPACNDDEMEFKPLDLNLNVYFNDENLSAPPKDDGNANSQGPPDDVTKVDQSAVDMKPNASFLFRSHSGGKFETACDVFIRDMLSESSTELDNDDSEITPPKIDSDSVKCSNEHENGYEFISKGLLAESECGDIDKTNGNDGGSEENIYQSLCEVKGDAESVKSYESFENYDEIAQSILDNKINLSELMKCEDDYIFPEKAPEPPPPRKNTVPKISSPILTSTTSNLVHHDLQVPKLKINYELTKSNSCASTTYEKIKYDQVSQQQQLKLPPRNDKLHPCDDENIYDTIKSGDKTPDKVDKADGAGESFADDNDNPYKNSKNDTMSIISNCYESISLKQNYSTINQILRHAISTTTLTSEHRINSIYGTMVGQSLTPPSDRSASDNSEEWIDLSDEENDGENVTDNRFIV